MAAQYLAEGLLGGDRCVYIGESRGAMRRLHEALAAMKVDADAATARGALVELTQDQFYLTDGRFDIDAVLARIESVIIAALDGGFAGVRGCADMSWLLRGDDGSQQVFEYEARINDFLRGRPVQALCQYDWRRMPPATIRGALITHPVSISR